MLLTEDIKDRLDAQARDIETRTGAEIVVVVAGRSDNYTYIPILWAALAALSLPLAYLLWQTTDATHAWGTFTPDVADVFLWQCLLFTGLVILFRLPVVQSHLIPQQVRLQRSRWQAHYQFLLRDVHTTPQRTGMLLFISVLERYVEVVPDTTLASRISNEHWQPVVDEFVQSVRSEPLGDSIAKALNVCEAVLQQHTAGDVSSELRQDAHELPQESSTDPSSENVLKQQIIEV